MKHLADVLSWGRERREGDVEQPEAADPREREPGEDPSRAAKRAEVPRAAPQPGRGKPAELEEDQSGQPVDPPET